MSPECPPLGAYAITLVLILFGIIALDWFLEKLLSPPRRRGSAYCATCTKRLIEEESKKWVES